MAIRTPVGVPGAGDEDRPAPSGALPFHGWWSDRAFLHRYCRSIVGDDDTADDIVQETYLRALDNVEKLESRASVVPWLVTVAKNLSLNELRRRDRHGVPMGELPEALSRPATDPADGAAVRDEVRSVLEGLSGRERRLLLRQIYHGRSVEQLAREEHTTPAAVRSLLMRARSKLRDALVEAGSRVLAPVAALGNWARKHLHSAGARAQQYAPALPASEGIGQVAAVAVAAIVLTAPGAPALDDPRPPVPGNAVDVVAATVVSEPQPVNGARSAAPVPAPRPVDDPIEATSDGATSPGVQGAAASDSGGEEAEGDSGVAPPLPQPQPQSPPAPPEEPINEEEPDDPENAYFDDLAYVPASSPDSSGHLFALGRPLGQCYTQQCTHLWHSADAGATWKKLPASGLDANHILPVPGYPADFRIYAMGPGGLQVSVDGGYSFQSVPGVSQSGPAVMSPGFSDGDERIYIGASPIWMYDAAGGGELNPVTGTAVGGTTPLAIAPDYVDTRSFFAGGETNGRGGLKQAAVYRCHDQSCVDLSPLPGAFGRPHVAVSSRFIDDSTVIAWTGKRLYASNDGGASFAAAVLPPAVTVQGVIDDGSGRFYAVASATSSGERDGVLRSDDGGQEWSFVDDERGPLAAGVENVVALSDGRLVASRVRGGGGGLFCSSNAGATWAEQCTE